MASSDEVVRIKTGELNGSLCNMFRDQLIQHILSFPGYIFPGYNGVKEDEKSPRKMTLPDDSIFLVAQTGPEASSLPIGSISLIQILPDSSHFRGLPSDLETVGEIKRIIVLEDHRHMGIGRKLIDSLETIAREQLGLKYLVVETAKDLTAAQRLYEKASYVRRPYWGLYDEYSWCYEKWL